MAASERKRRLSKKERRSLRAQSAGAEGSEACEESDQVAHAKKAKRTRRKARDRAEGESRLEGSEASPLKQQIVTHSTNISSPTPSSPKQLKKTKKKKGCRAVTAQAETATVEDRGKKAQKKRCRPSTEAEAAAPLEAQESGAAGPVAAKKAKQKHGKPGKEVQKNDSLPGASNFSPEVQRILSVLSDPSSSGTLSDRLNPTHSCFDKSLKMNWKSFSKKERAAIVECDQKKMKATVSAAVSIQHPFEVNDDDHCETAIEAYRDVVPILNRIAEILGKKPGALKIYDPYFCAGAVVKHMGELGFKDVYNKCEDFYTAVGENRVPDHDVLLTNPPYSGDHVERLLEFCRKNRKPFLLLMPNYFCAKDYYEAALGGAPGAKSMLYLCPRKRYSYWTPKGLRGKDKVQSQHSGAGGNRTSPFVSFWYLDLSPVAPAPQLLDWWKKNCGGNANTVLCKIDSLPHGCKP